MSRLAPDEVKRGHWSDTLERYISHVLSGRNEDGTVFSVPTSPSLAEQVSRGRFYLGTSARVTAALGEHIRGTLANPAGSGRTMLLVAFVGTVAADRMVVGRIYINPTAGLPTTTYTPFQLNLAVNSPAVGEFKADNGATALSGGTATDLYVAMHKGRNLVDVPGVVVPPGTTVGVDIPLATLEAGDGTFGAYWYEDDV